MFGGVVLSEAPVIDKLPSICYSPRVNITGALNLGFAETILNIQVSKNTRMRT